jgi:hypothetical protein
MSVGLTIGQKRVQEYYRYYTETKEIFEQGRTLAAESYLPKLERMWDELVEDQDVLGISIDYLRSKHQDLVDSIKKESKTANRCASTASQPTISRIVKNVGMIKPPKFKL